MKPDTVRHLALAVAITLALSLACSAPLALLNGEPTPTLEPPRPTGTAEPTATEQPAERVELDPCALLSEQDVADVLGGAVQAQPSMGTGGCTYMLPSDDPGKRVQVVFSAAQGNEAKAFTVLSMGLLAGFSGDPNIQAKFDAVNSQLPDLTLLETVTALEDLFRGTDVGMVEADGEGGHGTWLVVSNEIYSQGTLIMVREDTYVSLTQIGGDMAAAPDDMGELALAAFDRLPASFYVIDEAGDGSFNFSLGGEEEEATPTAPPEPTLPPTIAAQPTRPPTEGCVPVLLAPPDGAMMDNGCSDHSDPMTWEFTWSECPASQDYEIYVLGAEATIPAVNDHTKATSYLSESASYVTDRNRSGWLWKVRAMQNGVWGQWSPEGTFDVESVDTDCSTTN